MPYLAPIGAFLAENAATIGAVAGVASTGVAVYSANQQQQAAGDAKKAANQKLLIQQQQASAEAKQQRSLTQRRLATQLDAARVLAGASGVSGGSSQLVLESAYATDAHNDLATISANQTNAQRGYAAGYQNTLAEIAGRTPNMAASAFGAAAQGLGTGLSIYDGFGRLAPNTPISPRPAGRENQ